MEKRSAAYLSSTGIESDAIVAETYHQWTDRLQLVGEPLEAIRQISAVHLDSAVITALPDGEEGANAISPPKSSSSPAISSPTQIR